ncbi:MAG: hypothetical protein DRJ38_02365 [Thermoprotei archaeon]|nr:MAG: hypothetical protein DRJ38_02365 [Thermoprotei archaeon]
MRGNARIRLRELLEELTETLKRTSDPFKVNIKSILNELAEILPYLEYEDLIVDAEILSQIVEVIKEQEEWIRNRSAMLVLGPFIALLKIASLSKQELAKELATAWHPVVELEQITWTDVMRALNYLSARKKFVLETPETERLKTVSSQDLEELGLMLKLDLEKLADKIKNEILEELVERGFVEYTEVVKGKSILEVFVKAYVVSYLATAGEFSIVYDPLKERYYIVKPSNGEYQSIVIPLGGVTHSS